MRVDTLQFFTLLLLLGKTAARSSAGGKSNDDGDVEKDNSGLWAAAIITPVLLLFAGWYYQRHKRLVLDGKAMNGILSFVIFTLVCAPVLVVLCTIGFAALMAVAEDWPYAATFRYVVSTITGLATPLSGNRTPITLHGALIAMVISIWAIAVSGLIMGICSAMTYTTELVKVRRDCD